VDAKLSNRQQELCHLEQELERVSHELEETSDRKDCLQFSGPEVREIVAKTVTLVCF